MGRKKNLAYLDFCLQYNWTKESTFQFLDELFPNSFTYSDNLVEVIMKSAYNRYFSLTRDLMKENIEYLIIKGKLYPYSKGYQKRLDEANEYVQTHKMYIFAPNNKH